MTNQKNQKKMNCNKTDRPECPCGFKDVSCRTAGNGKKLIEIKHLRSQLLYDIANIGYVEGDVTEDELLHAKHTIQDICQSGNVDRVTRIMDLVHGRCADILNPISADEDEQENEDIDDTLEETDAYTITLKVESRFKQSTAKLICDIIHELIVSTVLWEWLGISNPKASEKWGYKQEVLWEQLRSIVYRNQGRVRRPLSPF